MNKRKIIKEVEKFLRKELKNESTGHDWWHAWRVSRLAKKIAEKEGGDLLVIELAALLHDVADWKFNKKDKRAGYRKIEKLLKKLDVPEDKRERVLYIVKNVSFMGAGVKNKMKTKEGLIVQDADKLDVLGAIGIGRVFAYGGHDGKTLYDPEIKPKKYKTAEEYKKNRSSSVNHFYEKILLLKNRMNTKTAKKIAQKRHRFLEEYLKQFFKEWNSEL